jgi:ATP-dependent DNA ligase
METALDSIRPTRPYQPQVIGFKYFYPERPRLIHLDQPLFKELDADPRWIAEPKYNGTRLQLHRLPDGTWLFYGRHGDPLVYHPNQEVKAALSALPLKGYWLFDGELRHNKTTGIQHRIALYDCFIASGNLLVGIPFIERRDTLEILFHYSNVESIALDLAPQYSGKFRDTFNHLTQDEEIEGLVLKNTTGVLDLGRSRAVNSGWMVKVRKPTGRWRF